MKNGAIQITANMKDDRSEMECFEILIPSSGNKYEIETDSESIKEAFSGIRVIPDNQI